jgi:hypothetical protein
MIAGSLREALEEFDGFGAGHVFFAFFSTREKSGEESRFCLEVLHGGRLAGTSCPVLFRCVRFCSLLPWVASALEALSIRYLGAASKPDR